MPDTPLVPGSSPWWMERLGKELDGRQAPMRRFEDYYTGRHPLLYAGSKFRAAFGNLFSGFSDNFCGLVADAVEERLDVEGFRMGASKDLKADDDAWRIWQANGMDAWSQILHIEALVKGISYVLVAPNDEDEKTPLISVQDATQMTTAEDPATHKRLIALKRWQDFDGTTLATLYYPDRIEKWQAVANDKGVAEFVANNRGWVKREVNGESWPLDNPIAAVPVVAFPNRPRLSGKGESEIAQVVPVQNGVNKLCLDMLVSAEFASFRQRWATGIETENDPDTGKPVEPFQAGIAHLWTVEDKDVKFGEFAATDLKNYTDAITMLIQHIASITRTPPHYLLGSMGSFPSGESIKAAETGLVAKARRRMRFFGEGHEEVIRLAFRILDDPRGTVMDSETIWRDPESRTEGEHVDALVKMGSLGVPQEVLWEKWGATPTEITRWRQMALAAQLSGAIFAPPPPRTPMPPAAGNGRNGYPVPTR